MPIPKNIRGSLRIPELQNKILGNKIIIGKEYLKYFLENNSSTLLRTRTIPINPIKQKIRLLKKMFPLPNKFNIALILMTLWASFKFKFL